MIAYENFGESFREALVLVAVRRLLVSVGDQALGVWVKEPVKLLPKNDHKVFKIRLR